MRKSEGLAGFRISSGAWLTPALILTQPFAFGVGGKQLSLTLIAAIIWVVWQTLGTRWRNVRGDVLPAYLALTLIVLAESLYNINRESNSVSILALGFFVVLYAVATLVFSLERAAANNEISTFSSVVAVLGVVGAAQVLLQVSGAGFFDYTDLPDSLVLAGYNNKIAVDAFGGIFKANGFIFLEPSYLSKYSALAIVIEVMTKRRISVLLGLACGLLFSFSGSGLLLIALAAPFLLKRVPVKFIGAGVACLLVLLTLAPGVIEQFSARRTEFTNPRSSAYIRFMAPYQAVVDGADDFNVLVGNGIGSLEDSTIGGITFFKSADSIEGKAYDVTAVKLLVELGLIGLLAYAYFFFKVANPRLIGWAAFMSLVSIVWITTGALLQAQTMLLVVALSAMLTKLKGSTWGRNC